MTAATETYAGMLLGDRYRLSERLAGGGMADVWRGIDELMDRPVAVKILRARFAGTDTDRRRFREEARIAGRLSHPGIAAVHDYGEARAEAGDGARSPDGQSVLYLVMELVAGRSLAEILTSGPLGTERTLDLVIQAARALDFAHSEGVVHRDVKPANLMVTPQDQVKVTDFGIARRHDYDPLTATGLLIGTPDYLAPELSRGASATPRSDIYALGVVTYECLTGRRPFAAATPVATLTAHVEQPPPPLPPSVPPGVAAAVMTALQKDPRRRFPSVGAFADALELVQRRSAPASPTITMARRPYPSRLVGPQMGGMVGAPDLSEDADFGPAGPSGEILERGGGPRRGTGQRALALFAAASLIVGVVGLGTGQGRSLLGRVVPVLAKRTPAPASSPPASASATVPPATAGTGNAGAASTPLDPPTADGQQAQAVVALVPDERLRPVNRARDDLSDRGFTNVSVARTDSTEVPRGRVVRTDPQAGTTIGTGHRITLYVSTGRVPVPDLVGRPVAEALDVLQNQLGLQVVVQPQPSDQPAGTVVSQDVQGRSLPAGGQVTLFVAAFGAQPADPRGGQLTGPNVVSGQHW